MSEKSLAEQMRDEAKQLIDQLTANDVYSIDMQVLTTKEGWKGVTLDSELLVEILKAYIKITD